VEWSRTLDLAAGRMCPAVALRQLLAARRRRPADARPIRPVPDRRPGLPVHPESVAPAPAPGTIAGGRW
jgi:hypothetical protein